MTVTRFSQASLSVPTKYRTLMAGQQALGDYELISTVVLSSSAASVTFSGLGTSAAAYKHLQLRITGRRATTGGNTLSMQCNGDTGANYTFHRVEGSGSTVASASGTGRTNMAVGQITGNDMQYTAFVCDILDFASSSKNKVIRSLTGYAGGNNIGLYSGAWLSTAAITSLTLFVELGPNLDTGSRFSLYGLKG